MLKFIRGWPPLVEALVVILGAFGYPIVLGVLVELGRIKVEVSEAVVLTTGLYELLALIVLCAFLWLRGWDIQRFGLQPERPDPLIAIGLAGLIWLLLSFLYELGGVLHLVPPLENQQIRLPLSSMSTIVVVVLYSFVDAAFEELFLCGYLFALAKEHKHLLLGVNLSFLVRLAYHVGDGSLGVITAIGFGLVCGGWYLKSGRLWPVILGHAFIQLMSFAAIS